MKAAGRYRQEGKNYEVLVRRLASASDILVLRNPTSLFLPLPTLEYVATIDLHIHVSWFNCPLKLDLLEENCWT